MKNKLKVRIGEAASKITVNVEVTGIQAFERRFKIGKWFILKGCQIIGCKARVAVIETEKAQ